MNLLSEVRHAIRVLRKSPGFTLSALSILGLGIGAGTAMFTAVNAVLLRPLPYEGAERLVAICETNPAVSRFCVGSPANVTDWSESTRRLESVGFARSWGFTLRTDEGSLGVSGGYATGGWFTALRARAQLGRVLEEADTRPGADRVAVLTHGLWLERFGGDRGIVDQSVQLDGESYRVAGVLEPGFVAPELEHVRLWTPPPWDPRDEERRGWRGFQVVGRLAEGATLGEARAELEAIAANLARAYPATNADWGVVVVSLHERIVGSTRPLLLVFSGAVALLLLIGCVNLANLMLVRATRRRREMAIRTAAGASRGRLVRQLLVESVTLALAGGVVGLVLASWATRLFVGLAPAGIPRIEQTQVDPAAFAFALLLALFTAAVFGLAPALWATRVDLAQGLRDGLGAGHSAGSVRLRRWLVAGELALTLMLLVGAGLLVRTFDRLLRWDPGFDRAGLVAVSAFAPTERYPNRAAVASLWQRLEQAVASAPGVEAVSTVSAGPVFGGVEPGRFVIVGDPAPESPPSLRWYDASPGYFRTLGLPILEGRDLLESDRPGGPAVGVINESLAKRFFAGRRPLGARIRILDLGEQEVEIVGVVADVTPFLAGQPPEPELWWSNRQFARWGTFFVVRAASNPEGVAGRLRSIFDSVDPEVQLGTPSTIDGLVGLRLIAPRFNALLVGMLALLALVLAAAGIYAVLSYVVTIRRREVGIRMALGAGRAEVLGRILREGAAMATLGLAAGLAGALALSGFLRSLLHGVAPHDPVTFGVTFAALALVALAACLVPAWRASRVDPAGVLREE